MLAELQHLASTLTACGLQPPACHPWVKPLEKGDYLVVSVGADGAITSVEFRASAETAGIAKIQKDNHNSFPAIKIRTPLWTVAIDDPRRAALEAEELPQERAALLRAICEGATPMESPDHWGKSASRVAEFSRELESRFVAATTNAPTLTALLHAIAAWNGDGFIQQLSDAAILAYAGGDATASGMIESLLIGTVRERDSTIEAGKITVVLDYARVDGELACRVVHPAMAEVYHRGLLATEPSNGAKRACSLTGREDELELHKLPNPKLPELNATFLMAMNKDAPCHLRYGMIGPSIFPIGKGTANEINDAILWITAPDREGKTWRRVPRQDKAAGGLPRNDLLIAYVEERPDLPAALADFFAGVSEAGPEVDFEATAESVVRAIDADGAIAPEAVIHTLVLRRIDRGRVQVELGRQYRVEQIRRGLREWRSAAANAPEFSLLVPKEKGQAAARCSPWCPSPAQVLVATKTVWIRHGQEKKKATRGAHDERNASVVGCSLSTVHDLFLAEGHELRLAAESLLARFIPQAEPLLLRCGEQLTRHGSVVKDMPVPSRRAAVLAATIIAMCLFKLNRCKEDYMEAPTFLLGRFLSLTDVLHEQYCRVVRKGDVPPQLLGYQHFAMAADNAESALAVLHSRLGVYYQWARTADSESAKPEVTKNVRIAQWAKNRMGEVAEQLTGHIPDRPLGDLERAEMLLGYLARIGKTFNGADDQQTDTGNEEMKNA
jgi:hypothetical protein